MSGRLVRHKRWADPLATALVIVAALALSLAVGVVGTLYHAQLLSAHTPWRFVPAALWERRAAPLVWKPFLAWFDSCFLLSMAGWVAALAVLRRRRDGGWTRIGVVRRAKLHDEEASMLLARISRTLEQQRPMRERPRRGVLTLTQLATPAAPAIRPARDPGVAGVSALNAAAIDAAKAAPAEDRVQTLFSQVVLVGPEAA